MRLEDRSVIEWNKDDLDELGILKVDVLALGMLSCIRRAFNLIRQHYGQSLALATVPQEEMRDDIWGNMGVRLGFNLIEGLRTDHANLIIARRRSG